MKFLTQLFKAVANERRIRILELLLKESNLSAGTIGDKLKIPTATVCRNLKLLERVNLVVSRRRNVVVYYSINANRADVYSQHVLDVIKRRTKKKTASGVSHVISR